MIRFLTLAQVIELHGRVVAQSGGSLGIRDLGALESALAQPAMGFGGRELYPELADKAAALGYALIQNHPFIDGNKRIGHAALEVFLVLNAHELRASIDDAEATILAVASGRTSREEFTAWVRGRVVRMD